MSFGPFTLDDYEITREGQVINKHNGHILAGQPNGKGYLRVSIGKKLMFIHRLVAEKYVPNPDHKTQVNHKDGNKLNNSADNLEWVSNQENRKHAIEHDLHLTGEKCSWSKLTEEDVRFIRSHPEISTTDLANMFNVSRPCICDVKAYRTWKKIS